MATGNSGMGGGGPMKTILVGALVELGIVVGKVVATHLGEKVPEILDKIKQHKESTKIKVVKLQKIAPK